MKILVLGATGQLGQCLYDQLSKTSYETIFSSRAEIDLSNLKSLKRNILAIEPNIVINASAYTAVDLAEDNPIQADLINHLAVKVLADTCCELNSWFIHISTDYVFDGSAIKPYKEDKKTNPRCIYGESKLNGEQAIKISGSKYLIIRTAWIFSEYGNNFFKTMLRLGAHKSELNIVGDQVGCPTYGQDLAKAIVKTLPTITLGNLNSAVFHFCGDQPCTWYEFAQSIFLEAIKYGLKAPTQINSIKTIDYPTAAIRPPYSVLDCTKIKNTFNISPSDWREGIKSSLKKTKDCHD
jgi:dTDP-4-dehydrorhamnose reductase